MAAPSPADKALDTIVETITAEGEINTSQATIMAEGILYGLQIGYGMDGTAFLAIHGNRIDHLTRQVLSAAGRTVAPRPGAMPRNI